MGYQLRDHTADVAVEATGRTLGSVFAAAADGMAAAMCETIPEEGGDRFELEVRAEGREALLFDYLDELIYERDVRAVLPVDNEAEVREEDGGSERREEDREAERREEDGRDETGEWVLEGSARGVPLEEISAREVKAVTYSEMALEETDEGWRAYVVLDV
ncbi:archease [Halorussus salinisoli]|uniref:archease n=1 Tax=Halorussus salinisoli TaxID=2558242 RepID=UPI0010C1B7AF|nr:archease [Halorussus salinisoli]